MEKKGLDAILSQEKDEILEGLKTMGEKKKEKKKEDNKYKYFRVVQASFDEPKKEPEKDAEPIEAPIKDSIEEPIEETIERSIEESIDEPSDTAGEFIEEPPYESVDIPIKEPTEEAEEEPVTPVYTDVSPKPASEDSFNDSSEEFTSKMKEMIESQIGKEITRDEAEALEREGNVFKKTIIIRREEAPVHVEPTPAKPTLKLKVRKNGKEYVLTDPIYTVGRNPNSDIAFIEEQYVGRTHAEITVGDDVVLRDLNSKNGTLVNGKRITSTILEEGDIVTFADVECIIGRA